MQNSQLGLSGTIGGTTNHSQQAFPQFVLAGGQYGFWFTRNQTPSLAKITMTKGDPMASNVSTVQGGGTVWTGGWNGTDWLFSGWGSSNGLNPYYVIYNSNVSLGLNFANYTQAASAEVEWNGGDIFSATWNGSVWLLTGMGSGLLFPAQGANNHYSIAFLTANGKFIDLSQSIPNNMDGILYSSSWNGKEWLVGGGWYGYNKGVLFTVSQTGKVADITNIISESVPTFNSVQSIAWNGTVWMIGGVGFLAAYDPTNGHVKDLTPMLDAALGNNSLTDLKTNSVNSMSWINNEWVFAGGAPVGYKGEEFQSAWVASMDSLNGKFSDITSSALPPSALDSSMSSILSMSCESIGCVFGGFTGNDPALAWYNGVNSTDISAGLNMTYVQWVSISEPAPANVQVQNNFAAISSFRFHWPRLFHGLL